MMGNDHLTETKKFKIKECGTLEAARQMLVFSPRVLAMQIAADVAENPFVPYTATL